MLHRLILSVAASVRTSPRGVRLGLALAGWLSVSLGLELRAAAADQPDAKDQPAEQEDKDRTSGRPTR
jgi:hypothetical protein